jgi:hypothetical protein
MSARRIGVVLALVATATGPGLAAAQTSLTVLSAIAPRQSAILIVDALPLEAEVRLDGVVIGTARGLTAQAMPILPGNHVLQVWAPDYYLGGVSFYSTPNWVSHVQVQLVPSALR